MHMPFALNFKFGKKLVLNPTCLFFITAEAYLSAQFGPRFSDCTLVQEPVSSTRFCPKVQSSLSYHNSWNLSGGENGHNLGS